MTICIVTSVAGPASRMCRWHRSLYGGESHMFSTNRWLTLAAAVALGFAFPGARAMAQGGTGTVGGKVTDEQGAAVAGAQVNIEQIGKGAVTGANGVYSIEAVPAGSHVVRVRIIG